MPLDMQAYLENRRRFLANRSSFPPNELTRYVGTWIAWSPDGARIVASARYWGDLEELVRNAGEDPVQCVLEAIPEEEPLLGGGFTAEDP